MFISTYKRRINTLIILAENPKQFCVEPLLPFQPSPSPPRSIIPLSFLSLLPAAAIADLRISAHTAHAACRRCWPPAPAQV